MFQLRGFYVPFVSWCVFAFITIGASYGQAKKSQQINLNKKISIKFEKAKYFLTQAQVARGVKFKYTITVHEDISGMKPASQRSARMPSPCGLLPFEKIVGNKQFYGIADVGLGPPIPLKPVTIKKGDYKREFTWDGKNWRGPSDTNMPKGKPFPPGTYDMTVSVVGHKQTPGGLKGYRVSETVKIVLTK